MLCLYCLLTDNPKISAGEEQIIKHNEAAVAHYGRQKDLMLEYYRQRRLSEARTAELEKAAADSVQEQTGLEEKDRLPFDEYLRQYYRQLEKLDG